MKRYPDISISWESVTEVPHLVRAAKGWQWHGRLPAIPQQAASAGSRHQLVHVSRFKFLKWQLLWAINFEKEWKNEKTLKTPRSYIMSISTWYFPMLSSYQEQQQGSTSGSSFSCCILHVHICSSKFSCLILRTSFFVMFVFECCSQCYHASGNRFQLQSGSRFHCWARMIRAIQASGHMRMT